MSWYWSCSRADRRSDTRSCCSPCFSVEVSFSGSGSVVTLRKKFMYWNLNVQILNLQDLPNPQHQTRLDFCRGTARFPSYFYLVVQLWWFGPSVGSPALSDAACLCSDGRYRKLPVSASYATQGNCCLLCRGHFQKDLWTAAVVEMCSPLAADVRAHSVGKIRWMLASEGYNTTL